MRRALELAWEAFRAGSFPVGAVVLDGTGEVVAEGRNRMGETQAPDGRLRNTGLAHAEIDALAQLPLGDYEDHTLLTTLEPCLLCRSAITMTHIGSVDFLARDSLCDGLDRLPSINAYAARRYPTMHGPGTGVDARFAAVLPMAVMLAFNPDGETMSHYRQHSGDDVRAAERIVAGGLWPSKRLDLDGAIAAISSVLLRS